MRLDRSSFSGLLLRLRSQPDFSVQADTAIDLPVASSPSAVRAMPTNDAQPIAHVEDEHEDEDTFDASEDKAVDPNADAPTPLYAGLAVSGMSVYEMDEDADALSLDYASALALVNRTDPLAHAVEHRHSDLDPELEELHANRTEYSYEAALAIVAKTGNCSSSSSTTNSRSFASTY